MINKVLKYFKATPLEQLSTEFLHNVTDISRKDVKTSVISLEKQGHVKNNRLTGYWLKNHLENNYLGK